MAKKGKKSAHKPGDKPAPGATTESSPAAATVPANPSAVPVASSMPTGDIRGVLIQIAGARLLLPNATIAEVLSYAPPEPVGDDAPAWLLGRMRWRGWQLPLLAFAQLAGIGEEQAGLGSKVVVLKALGGNAKAPYFAIVIQGFPRLVTVSRDALVVEGDEGALPQAILARVQLNEDSALIPDLEAVENLVNDALAQAA